MNPTKKFTIDFVKKNFSDMPMFFYVSFLLDYSKKATILETAENGMYFSQLKLSQK